MVKKLPSVWGKMSENRRGDFLTHTVYCDGSDFPPRVREETSITCDGEVFSMVL